MRTVFFQKLQQNNQQQWRSNQQIPLNLDERNKIIKKIKSTLFYLKNNIEPSSNDPVKKAEYQLFEKIGVETLKKVIEPQCHLKKELAVTFLEKLCHFINKFIRGISGGYLGYPFSSKEAKEALLDVLKTGKALNENTRFNEVCKSYAAKVNQEKDQSQINLDGGFKYQ